MTDSQPPIQTGVRSTIHVCGHCKAFLLEVDQTEANWAGLVCDNAKCPTFVGSAHRPEDNQFGDGYRKRPVVIQAKQWFRLGDHPKVSVGFRRWATREEVSRGQAIDIEYAKNHNALGVVEPGRIVTLEGVMEVMPGDWIIRGVQGEFYPCRSDIFEATYDRA